MTTAIEYALMSGASYISNRADINKFPIPDGWLGTKYDNPPDGGGFEAISFINGADIAHSSEIVISFAGTDFSLEGISDFTNANIPLVLGIVSEQLKQAAEYYLQVKALNPGAHISLTGHSLGGGLAALIGVFFGETAFTFDQAPFAQTAKLGATVLKSYLLTDGYTETELSSLTNFIGLQESNGGIPNEGLVTNLNVQGEIVSLGSALRIGNSASIPQGTPFDPLDVSFAIDLHSEALLSALLQSNQSAASGQSLSDVTVKLPDLLKMIFSDQLFAHPVDKSNTTEENFLERLVRHEAGVGATATGSPILADAMVTRFTSDLWKVAQNGGFTLTNQHITNTLVAFAMQMYYENPEAAVADKTLFTSVTGGIRFDRTEVSATLSGAKGWQLYFQNYLNTLTLEEHRIVLQLLPAATDWFIQAGNVSMSATADISTAFMVGGTGNDWMVGGSQADLLIGNAGDDTLNGDAGNDTLMGGAGNDTYILDPGDGYDTILDTDGSGSIILDGITLSGGALVAGAANVWKDSANGLTYTLQGSGADQVLIVGKDSSNTGLRIQGWQAGQLDLNMIGTIAPPANTTITGADGYSDGLIGSGGMERILGLSGNDALDGGGGDDVIEGGTGDDLLAGGAGSDIIYGGAGRDMILSAADLALQLQKDRNNDGVLDDWAAPTGAGAVWTSGRLWGIYATNDGSEIVDGGGPESQDSAGDIVFAGGDDDKVIGGLGDDYIDGGVERHDSAPNISICLLHQLNTPNNQNLTRAYN